MENSQVQDILNDIPVKLQTASLKGRRQVVEEIKNVLSNPDITESEVGYVCDLLGSTLHRYRDTTSQSYVRQLLTHLAVTHRDWTLKTLPPVLLKISEKLKNTGTSKITCQSGLYALRWSTILVGSALKTPSEVLNYKTLVLAQANLLATVVAYGDKRKYEKAYSMVHAAWSATGGQAARWAAELAAQAPDAGPHVAITMSALCRHFRESGDVAAVIELKSKMLEFFTKSLISVKARPNANYIRGCADLLRSYTPAEIQAQLLPALQKAMLRSPETIIEAVGEVVDVLDRDLDGAIVEIGKSLIGNLHSKDEWVRKQAAAALARLARRCPAGAVARALLAHVFAVYNGEGGKLSSSEDKIAVLNGAALLSCLPVSVQDRAALYTLTSTQIAKALDSETSERTLSAGLDALAAWTAKETVLPDSLLQQYKKTLSAKSTTPLVRVSCASLVSRALRVCAATEQQRAALTPSLQAAVEKAEKQPLQHITVSEGICSMLALTALDAARSLPARGALWALLAAQDKHVLLQERVLAVAADDVLIQVVWLCRSVLENYPSVASESKSPVIRAFLFTLLSPSKTVRDEALENVKAMLANKSRGPLAKTLVAKLGELLDEKTLANKDKPAEERTNDVTGKIILDCVYALCSNKDYPETDASQLAVEALKPSHHPLAAAADARAWLKLARHLRQEPRKLISLYANNLKNSYIVGFRPDETISNIVSTLVSVDQGATAEAALQCCLNALRDDALLRVTRDEYFTYLTPPGELYDKSAVPANDDTKEMNLKRESKVYSYKEQQEELQLRREIEEKRRREGKVKQVTLTAKQKEAIKTQEIKEKAIRDKLQVLDSRVESALGLLAAVQRGAPLAVCERARSLVPAALGALRSPLCAERVLAVVRALRAVLLPRPALYDTVARVTIRLYDPQCDLDPAWEEEPLAKATKRTIALLHAETVGSRVVQSGLQAAADEEMNGFENEDDNDEDDDDDNEVVQRPEVPQITHKASNCLTAPGFCFVFPLLKLGLTTPFKKEGGGVRATDSDEAIILNGVQIIEQHAEVCGGGGSPVHRASSGSDLSRAALLPLDHMFTLLIELISTTSGRIQSASTVALLATAERAADAAAAPDLACLLAGLRSPMQVVRDASLRALAHLEPLLARLLLDARHALPLARRLLVAKHDVWLENANLATELWSRLPEAEARCADSELVMLVLEDIRSEAEPVQRAAAAALAALAARAPLPALPGTLCDMYKQALPLIPAKLDQFGHVVEAAVDEWGARVGVAFALTALAPHLEVDAVTPLMEFFVSLGLGDRAEPVRAEMLNAAMEIVELHGKATISSQLPIFEGFLDRAPKSAGNDAVRECVVLLVGSLARHLEPQDPRIKPITLKLVAALSTPSQQVQEAVSNCLPYLVTSPAVRPDIPAIVNKLMKQLLTAEKYGDRKGAAYGIGGIVKGLGILALKQLDIMVKLTEAIQEKKNYKYREGALFAFEMLCQKLQRLFEPYIVHVLPYLLMCFGDQSQYVRAAADETAKLIMSKLSAHGVKLVLPSLLAALQDDNWRTKAGSVELLGAMAFCAPKQLSSCLPSIVPKLIEVLSDSHMRVQAAGAEALRVIGSVIRNPEIQAIVPQLLLALQDPSARTAGCLQTLLDTKFVHFIDAPSLALIMPVVQRAFLDRSTETRKMAAQIIGNMYSLTDQKDLTPYLPNIIPGLKQSLLDPVPEVRSVSARALGAMVKGMGESSFEELLPWLMQTLTSESSSVDRSGAAQGLAEVVAGLGQDKLHKLMPDIIATAERTDIAPHVKDGYIMMFIYMPGAFTDEFTPYIGQIINPILKALADENEYVRETALKAGQRIVNLYAESAITLLLPELENGLFDDNWRIRYSSVQLLGDLLYRISGVSGKMSTETASEDDNFGTEQSHKAIMHALGPDRRNRVLAGLYMGRSDVALMVRQAALHVWKVVVTNTPKTLREILPTLFSLLLGCLASTSFDKRQVAARTLGDLVRKLGERVLPEIVPILERGLLSDRPDQRQGVCIGLGEIISSCSRDSIMAFADGLVPTVRTALMDPLAEVRQAAARTFDSLHATIGSKALDDILPRMLAGLRDPDPERAEAILDGLRQVMAIKSRAVLPYLVPVLTAPPVDTRALSALAAAAGSALARHLHKVLPALLAALATAAHQPNEAKELEHCRDALLPMADEGGVRSIIDTLLETSRSGEAGSRRAAASLLCAFVAHTRADLSPYLPQLLRGLIILFAHSDGDIVQQAWVALSCLTAGMDSEQLVSHVSDVRQAVRFAASERSGQELPGFCLPKGIAPILPLFKESITSGLPEEKEAASLMLGEVIRLTSADALQPSVVGVTGPLIRILGDRYSASVKAAVLDTLATLLAKVGTMLKQFLPQLQTSFLRSLHDPQRNVRVKAGLGLSHLVKIHSRADPLFQELHAGLKSTDDPGVRETLLQALRSIITGGGDKLGEPLALALLTTLTSPALLAHADDPPRGAVGGCLGALLHCLPPPHQAAALQHHVLGAGSGDPDWQLQHGRSCALFVAIKETPEVIYTEPFVEKIDKVLLGYLASDKVPIVCNGIRGIGYLIQYLLENDRPVPQNLLSQFVRTINHNSNEVKQLLARASTTLGRTPALGGDGAGGGAGGGAGPVGGPAADVLRALLPALVNGTKEKNAYVRAHAESALRAVLRLPEEPEFQQRCLALLEPGARASLAEVVARAARRAPDARDEELDCTLVPN